MDVLYMLLSHDGMQVKIGITKSLFTLKRRLVSLGGIKLFDFESSRFFNCERAKAVEQYLHFHFRAAAIAQEDAFVKDGVTECFSSEILQSATDFVEANSAGQRLTITKDYLLGVGRVANYSASAKRTCIAIESESRERAARSKAQAQIARARWNESALSKFAELLKSWDDRGVFVGRYFEDGDLFVALKPYDKFGVQYEFDEEIYFADLEIFPRTGSFNVFPEYCSNEHGWKLTVANKLFNDQDDDHWVVRGLRQVIDGLPTVPDDFDVSALNIGTGAFWQNFECEFSRFGEARA